MTNTTQHPNPTFKAIFDDGCRNFPVVIRREVDAYAFIMWIEKWWRANDIQGYVIQRDPRGKPRSLRFGSGDNDYYTFDVAYVWANRHIFNDFIRRIYQEFMIWAETED